VPDLLLRDLDPELMQRLKEQAKRSGRSVQAEIKTILANNIGLPWDQAVREMEEFRKRFAGRTFSDSSELIREDRER
jgi:plasmid stability protein